MTQTFFTLTIVHVIPNSDPAGVRRHVKETFNLLGESGGLILSTHDIPRTTPDENIEVMVSAIKECTY